MCKVKGCRRPMFLGGLCGRHALERRERAATEARAPRPRRRRAAAALAVPPAG